MMICAKNSTISKREKYSPSNVAETGGEKIPRPIWIAVADGLVICWPKMRKLAACTFIGLSS